MANLNYWISLRSWMYNRLDAETGNFTEEFQAGVQSFLEFASNQTYPLENKGKFYCPCRKCKNEEVLPHRRISNHIFRMGFTPGYYIWYKHGEELNIDLGTSGGRNVSSGSGNRVESGSGGVYGEEDRYVEMVNDAFCDTMNPENIYQDEEGVQNASGPNAETQRFYEMLEAAKKPLYEGCREGRSELFVASRMMNIKAGYEMSENCVDEVLELMSQVLPEDNNSPASFYDLKKIMRKMGLRVITIEVCVENCMIFWKEDEQLDK